LTIHADLTRYQRVIPDKDKDSFFSTSYDPMDEIETVRVDQDAAKEDVKYGLHIPKDFHIMVVVNNFAFPSLKQITPEYRLSLIHLEKRTAYLPAMDLGQLYIPTKRSDPLTLDSAHNLTLQILPFSYHKYLMFYSFTHFDEFKKNFGPLVDYMDMREEVLDEMKEILFENSIWIVVLFFGLSLAETILRMAYLKS
jgi:hypothetical protein